MPICHILLCVYFPLLYNLSSLRIVDLTSESVLYLIGIVSLGYLSKYTSNDLLLNLYYNDNLSTSWNNHQVFFINTFLLL